MVITACVEQSFFKTSFIRSVHPPLVPPARDRPSFPHEHRRHGSGSQPLSGAERALQLPFPFTCDTSGVAFQRLTCSVVLHSTWTKQDQATACIRNNRGSRSAPAAAGSIAFSRLQAAAHEPAHLNAQAATFCASSRSHPAPAGTSSGVSPFGSRHGSRPWAPRL
eukprot:SAG11_NODE_459_length_9261_cov_7.747463_6_plen_165_part_00